MEMPNGNANFGLFYCIAIYHATNIQPLFKLSSFLSIFFYFSNNIFHKYMYCENIISCHFLLLPNILNQRYLCIFIQFKNNAT